MYRTIRQLHLSWFLFCFSFFLFLLYMLLSRSYDPRPLLSIFYCSVIDSFSFLLFTEIAESDHMKHNFARSPILDSPASTSLAFLFLLPVCHYVYHSWRRPNSAYPLPIFHINLHLYFLHLHFLYLRFLLIKSIINHWPGHIEENKIDRTNNKPLTRTYRGKQSWSNE